MKRPALEQSLRRVQLRCHGNRLLGLLAWSLAAAGAAAAVLAAAEQSFGLGLFRLWFLPVLAGAACAAAVAAWYRRRTGLLEVAVLMDVRLGLKERVSTSLALAGSHDPFAEAVCADAHHTAEGLDLKGKFPVRLTRRWFWPVLSWAAAASVLLFLPPLDLLGRQKDRKDSQDQARQLQQARQDVQKAVEKIDVSIRPLADPALSAELAKVAQAGDALKAEDVKREAIRKLGELTDLIKKAEGSPKMESAKTLGDMLKGLRSPPGSPLPQLNRDIAKGDFKHAADQLRELQKKLEEGGLTKEQQEALAKQLGDLGKQLEDLASKNSELKDALQEAGLDKELAGLSPEDLEKALKDKGLTDEQIKELMEKAEACDQACSKCESLAKALKACSGLVDGEPLTPEELAELLEAVEGMEAEGEGLGLCRGALGSIDDAVALLGGQGEFSEGLALKQGPGTGRPGIGYGARKSDDAGQVAHEKTKVEGPQKDGPVVASWLIKGSQVKGESKKELQDVIQAGRDAAAEAIQDNEIPRKYELPVKKYFGDLEESSKKAP